LKDKIAFEFDENKSQTNKEKYGISFEEAKILWENDNALVVPAKNVSQEERFALISMFGSKCYVAIFTIRDGKYRIISVRRCRKNYEQNYEQNTK